MPFQVHYYDDLIPSDYKDNAAAGLEQTLNSMEEQGWTLVQFIPQQKVWDEDGNPDGTSDSKFVFHKPAQPKPGNVW